MSDTRSLGLLSRREGRLALCFPLFAPSHGRSVLRAEVDARTIKTRWSWRRHRQHSTLVSSSATSSPTAMRLLLSPQLSQPPSLRVSPTMAAAPEVQVAFAAVMLLSVSHGVLPQPNSRVQSKQPQSSSSQQRTAPGSRRSAARPRAGKPRLCEEEPLSVEEVTVTAAEEMTAMEYVTFFGYIGGFLAFFYAIGAATKLFS